MEAHSDQSHCTVWHVESMVLCPLKMAEEAHYPSVGRLLCDVPDAILKNGM